MPYFLISGLIGKYISEAAVMADVVRTSVLILICFTVKYILYGEGLNLSHEGAFGTLYNMRVKLADELMHQPLGEVATADRGKYKKSFVEEIGRIELMLAHMPSRGNPQSYYAVYCAGGDLCDRLENGTAFACIAAIRNYRNGNG